MQVAILADKEKQQEIIFYALILGTNTEKSAAWRDILQGKLTTYNLGETIYSSSSLVDLSSVLYTAA